MKIKLLTAFGIRFAAPEWPGLGRLLPDSFIPRDLPVGYQAMRLPSAPPYGEEWVRSRHSVGRSNLNRIRPCVAFATRCGPPVAGLNRAPFTRAAQASSPMLAYSAFLTTQRSTRPAAVIANSTSTTAGRY